MPESRTICDTFFSGLEIEKRDRVLAKRGGSWTEMSTSQFAEQVRRAAGALRARGIRAGDSVAILSYNRPEWAIADYAILVIGAVTVPIYSTLPADQIEFILNDSGAKLVFAENADQIAKLGGRPAIAFEGAAGTPFDEFLKAGAVTLDELRRDAATVVPDAMATIIYTSGTTGTPKGVMLSHGNLASNLIATDAMIRFTRDDVALSFLPLSHSFERLTDFALFYKGATIAYAESIDKLAQNIGEVRPTMMAAVPRVYEKFHAKILDGVRQQSPRAQSIFHWATAVGGLCGDFARRGVTPPLGLRFRRWIADKLVFRKLRAKLGGRMRLFISGSAPLSREITEFFWSTGLPLIEGYGLTETSPVIAVNAEGATRLGTVGRVIPGVTVKIAEDGEILCKGPNVMKGYYNRAEDTAAVMKDGWFCTGDIGELDADGYLKITDRKKDLLKTSGGKYIAPQPIENKLKLKQGILNAVVIGDRQKFAAALIVAAPGVTNEQVQAGVDAVNKDLAHHETLKKWARVEKDFTIEAGELTPTLKVKRRVVEKKYADLIAKLYAGGE